MITNEIDKDKDSVQMFKAVKCITNEKKQRIIVRRPDGTTIANSHEAANSIADHSEAKLYDQLPAEEALSTITTNQPQYLGRSLGSQVASMARVNSGRAKTHSYIHASIYKQILIYNMETWALTQAESEKLVAFHRSHQTNQTDQRRNL